jgi:cytochrome P450
MYPIGPLVARDSISNSELGPYIIPPGSQVHLYYQYAMNDPRHWQNPNAFRPERFLHSFDPTPFLPFGVGPRGCAGCAPHQQSSFSFDVRA